MFQLGRHKTLEPDGLMTNFFQRCWQHVELAVIEFLKGVFNSETIPVEMNQSNICLLPKTKHLKDETQFRPIYLSNVVTKIIVNRMRPFMNDLIGEGHTIFIFGCQTTSIIVIAQEMLHSLRRKKGRKGFMIAKIDSEKTYNRIYWQFLQEKLRKVGVEEKNCEHNHEFFIYVQNISNLEQ